MIMMDRKKELKQQYKQMKHPMGIFIIRSKLKNKCYLQTAQDLRGVMNGALVRLNSGSHPFLELQREWTELGADNFAMEILEQLEYDDAKTDYTDDLELLQMIWEEKLAKENVEFYEKRI
ncbi:MAG: GIY-YIG nuclease family protein [Candidatus Saccharibacteria bacterium]